MSEDSQYITNYYNRLAEYEWARLERHRTEFSVTIRALESF